MCLYGFVQCRERARELLPRRDLNTRPRVLLVQTNTIQHESVKERGSEREGL